MNTYTKRFLIGCSSLCVAAAASLSAQTPGISVRGAADDCSFVVRAETDPLLKVGASRQEVLAKIGKPSIRINRNEWAYRNVVVTEPAEGMPSELDALIVTFEGDRMTGFLLMNHTALDAYADYARHHRGQVDALRCFVSNDGRPVLSSSELAVAR